MKLAVLLARRAKFFGAMTVEFKRDAVDGRLKLIKVDPRLVRATSLSTALGLDIPTALFKTFASPNGSLPCTANYCDGVGWIWLEAYLYSVWKHRHDRSLRRELLELIKRAPRIRACAYFDPRDPLPSLVLAFTALRRLRMLEKRGFEVRSTRPASG